MNFLRKLLRRDDEQDGDTTITLDVEQRRAQLTRLEKALDTLAEEMRQCSSVANPGWRGRVNEYSRLAADAAQQRREVTREGLLDLVFEIRPVFSGAVPPGMESLVPLQDEAMAAAEELRELLPGESA